MQKSLSLLLMFISFLKLSNAQSSHVAGFFPTFDLSGMINQKLEYSLYYFAALPLVNFDEPKTKMDVHFLLFYGEQALTYHLNKKLSLTASYVYQRENVFRKNYTNENRIHLQATYKHSTQQINFKHRLRFDNRFVQNRTTLSTPYTHRLRYLIGLDFPIKSKKNNLYFTAYQEAFFNTFQNATAIYAENWAYLGLGYQFNDKHKIETGPLYITWNIGENAWFHQWYWQMTWISRISVFKS